MPTHEHSLNINYTGIHSVLHGYEYTHGFHVGLAAGTGTGTRLPTRQKPVPVIVMSHHDTTKYGCSSHAYIFCFPHFHHHKSLPQTEERVSTGRTHTNEGASKREGGRTHGGNNSNSSAGPS